ncbi:hypothetical protein CTA1_12810 [Colletotrichum tanaceti]|uniref:Uncharacterized protein n=1 Tax=Colletotrichum tanaceti TaxID=1306861 RepID=A0A4U6X9D5_9PEZI|nr:hypothetical protein CTA1_12810 [Colletotrichum tanaceti]
MGPEGGNVSLSIPWCPQPDGSWRSGSTTWKIQVQVTTGAFGQRAVSSVPFALRRDTQFAVGCVRLGAKPRPPVIV